jgi:uncharacterized membrane protein
MMNIFVTYKYGKITGIITIIWSWVLTITFSIVMCWAVPDESTTNTVIALVVMICGIGVSLTPIPQLVYLSH